MDVNSSISVTSAESHKIQATLMIPREPVVDAFYRLENAAAAVKRAEGEVDSLAHYINYNSAHGYFEEQVRLKLDLQSLRELLDLWHLRYFKAGLDVVK